MLNRTVRVFGKLTSNSLAHVELQARLFKSARLKSQPCVAMRQLKVPSYKSRQLVSGSSVGTLRSSFSTGCTPPYINIRLTGLALQKDLRIEDNIIVWTTQRGYTHGERVANPSCLFVHVANEVI